MDMRTVVASACVRHLFYLQSPVKCAEICDQSSVVKCWSTMVNNTDLGTGVLTINTITNNNNNNNTDNRHRPKGFLFIYRRKVV
jgi:hypothetical protein